MHEGMCVFHLGFQVVGVCAVICVYVCMCLSMYIVYLHMHVCVCPPVDQH